MEIKNSATANFNGVLHFLSGHLFQTASNNQNMTFYRGFWGKLPYSDTTVLHSSCTVVGILSTTEGGGVLKGRGERIADKWVRLCLILALHKDRNWSPCSTACAPNSLVQTQLKNIIKHFAEQRICSHTLLNEGFWWTSKHRKMTNKLKMGEGNRKYRYNPKPIFPVREIYFEKGDRDVPQKNCQKIGSKWYSMLKGRTGNSAESHTEVNRNKPSLEDRKQVITQLVVPDLCSEQSLC